MTREVGHFYNSIPDVTSLRQSELIPYFVYYLIVEAGEASATPAGVNRCFEGCDLAVPANSSARLLEQASGSSPKLIKAGGGYRLHRFYREEIERRVGNSRAPIQTSNTLRELETRVSAGGEKAFLGELISCFEAGANRATIVMCWILTIDHLFDYVFKHKLSAFNAALSKIADKRVRTTQIQSRDDFAEIPEGKFIELLRSAGIISNDVRKILDEKLGTRNSSAHPSGVSIKPSKVVEFVDDLVENVILKYAI